MEFGWAGMIVHGCIRDVDAIAGMDFGVQALAAIALKSVRRGMGKTDPWPLDTSAYTSVSEPNGIIVSAKPLL